MNQVNLIGRLGKDPEVKYTGQGKAVCNFSLAVDRGGGSDKETDWIDCVIWERAAEVLGEYVTKGRQVAITGRLQVRKWQDNDGNQRRAVEVVVSQLHLLAGSRDDQAGGGGGQQNRGGGGGQQQRGGGGNSGRQQQQSGGGRRGQQRQLDEDEIDPNDIPF